jgi:hypothetical protein
LPLRDRA